MTFLTTDQIFLWKHTLKELDAKKKKNLGVYKNIYKKNCLNRAKKQQRCYQHPLQAQCLLREKCLFY